MKIVLFHNLYKLTLFVHSQKLGEDYHQKLDVYDSIAMVIKLLTIGNKFETNWLSM